MPKLRVSPESVKPGDAVTITYEGLIYCEGDANVFPKREAQVSLAKWTGIPTPEPFTPPAVVQEDWGEFSLTSGLVRPLVVVVPQGLASGQYYAFFSQVDLVATGPFTVGS
jgi:hypothetical protein